MKCPRCSNHGMYHRYHLGIGVCLICGSDDIPRIDGRLVQPEDDQPQRYRNRQRHNGKTFTGPLAVWGQVTGGKT